MTSMPKPCESTTINSLQTICFGKINKIGIKNLNEILPGRLYRDYIIYLLENNFDEWKQKIKLVNLEVNIKKIYVDLDMYFDEPVYNIYIQKKVYDEDEAEDGEFIRYHKYHDNIEEYDLYYEIARLQKYICYDCFDDDEYEVD